jgi:DnaJ family protein C protein 19
LFVFHPISYFIVLIHIVIVINRGPSIVSSPTESSEDNAIRLPTTINTMSFRAASAGRMALQSRANTRLLARTNTTPSSSILNSNSNSWQEFKYSHHHRYQGSANELHTFATRLSLEDKSDDREKDEQSKRRLQSTLPSIHTNSYSPASSSSSAITSQSRFYHTTPPQERAVAIILGAGALSATAYAASSAITAYKEYQASIPDPPTEEEMKEEAEAAAAAAAAGGKEKQQQKEEAAEPNEKSQPAGERENIFTKWFGVGVGAKYYEGGFEESMTRREAALILGIRESSSAKRIKDAHRKLLILNHPDTGGSTYMSLKINEAKELLLKGKGRV